MDVIYNVVRQHPSSTTVVAESSSVPSKEEEEEANEVEEDKEVEYCTCWIATRTVNEQIDEEAK